MRVFEVENGVLKINDNCFRIAALKAILDKYEDPIPALSYCDFMTNPESPYLNVPLEEKQQAISDNVGGDFNFDDEEIEAALVYLRKLYRVPMEDLYEGGKNSLQVIGAYLKSLTTNSIKYGKDGNLGDIFRMQKEMGKVAENFMKVEKLWTEQVKQKLRGSAETGEY